MSIEMAGIAIRFIVMAGAILSALSLLIFGFYIVAREYRLLDTWEKMKQFLSLTTKAGFQADLAKGTLSLSRTTPGLLLIAIGSAILIACILQKYELTMSSQQTKASNSPGSEAATVKFQDNVATALQQINGRLAALERQPTQKPNGSYPAKRSNGTSRELKAKSHSSIQRKASSTQRPRLTPRPKLRIDTHNGGNFVSEVGGTSILDKWLTKASDIKGIDPVEQLKILFSAFGTVQVGLYSILTDSDISVGDIALEVYGNRKYAPLIRAFNPKVPDSLTIVPIYTRISYYAPISDSEPVTPLKQIQMRIRGMSRAMVYDEVLSLVNRVEGTKEYRADPKTWWQTRFPTLGQEEFVRALQDMTGRPWGYRQIISEDKDTLETLSMKVYGNRKYVELIRFINFGRTDLPQDPGIQLPPSTSLWVMDLTEL